MKKQLTPEQTAKRDERRAKFKTLWKQVAAMPELERIKFVGARAFTSCNGHAYSLGNSMMIALQVPGATILGGFRQWLKHGRAVRKGEHGAMIWVPLGNKQTNAETGETSTVMDEKHFTSGSVFDISQTSEIEALEVSANLAAIPAPAISDNLIPEAPKQSESRETVLASMTQNFFSNMQTTGGQT